MRQPIIHNTKHHVQIGAGTSNERIIEPGKGLVGQAVAAGTASTEAGEGGGGGILVANDPSKEKAFVAEFDLPAGEEAAGDR